MTAAGADRPPPEAVAAEPVRPAGRPVPRAVAAESQRPAGGPAPNMAVAEAVHPAGGPAPDVVVAEPVRLAGRPVGRAVPGLRLARLYLASRRVLTCLLVLAAAAVALRIALHWLPRSGVAARQLPLTIEAGAAAAIGVTARSPFGEAEDTAGPWLPWLRLAVSLALAGAALGALAAGAAGQHLADGTLGLLRDLGGFTGLALLTAALVGGGLAWIGPLAYAAVTLPALAGSWTTPWTWAARPPHDRGAAICAGLAFAAGLALLTARGARARARDD